MAAGARVTVLVITAVMLAMPSLVGQTEPVDLQAVYKIKDEGLQRSKVMEIASYLTDVYGPRLTGSPDIRRAGEWAVKELQSWGLANVKLEPWTGFGRGWTNERFSAHMTAPATSTLIGYPKAWTPGTNGVVKGEAMVARLDSPSDLETWRGKLKGKFVLTAAPRPVTPHFSPQAERFTDAELADLARQPVSSRSRPRRRAGRRRRASPVTGPRSSSPRACLPPSSRAAATAAPCSCRAADRETRRIHRPCRRSC